MVLDCGLIKTQKSLYFAILNNNLQEVQNIFNINSYSNIQKVFRSQFPSGRTIFDVAKSIGNEEIIQTLQQKANEYTNALWNKRKETQNSLRLAIVNSNLREVLSILEKINSEEGIDYTQEVLRSKFDGNYTILDFAILQREKDIVKALWQEANEDTRVFLSNSAIKLANKSSDYDVKKFIPEVKDYNRKYTEKATKQTYEESNQKNGICGRAIQKVENLERTSDLHHKLRQAIDYLDVKKVKAVLEDCDTNLAMILNRPIHSQSKTTFLLYPLQVGLNKRYIGDGKRLKQEDLRNIKEITKLLWDKASPDIRNFWFKFHQDQQEESTKDTKATFEAHLKKAPPDIRDLWLKYQRVPENQGAAVIKLLKGEQQRHAKIGSEKWLEDFIQEVKDYREQKTIEENLEIATEKPTTKSVLQDAQLSQINRTCCIL
ncbi:hypothetical protein [Wolbachia endosymbiont (group B) of Rhopobota naevana]|uniref:hypothetical protein n=1 Tax=Wolbachia endosymbiont (group B) of Rhopobota naevana TaxID=2954054 RepID=UPI0022263A93|nr:hypothetical protein [Wolbachia endosymbiont (group B) of Rhopobota naevana]